MVGSTMLGTGGAGYPMARQLLRRAQLELDAADETQDPQMRFLHAHMAAIRAASAVLAIDAPPRRRRRVQSVWEQLSEVGSEWERWAATFAAAAPVRAAIEAGRLTELEPRIAEAAVVSAQDLLSRAAAAVRGSDTVAAAPLAS